MFLQGTVEGRNQGAGWSARGKGQRTADGLRWREGALYELGRAIMDAYGRLVLEMDVVRHVPLPSGAKIIAANHPTTVDPFLMLTWTAEQVSILVTEACFKVPVFGRYLRAAGHVPVVQGNGRAAFEEARQLLERGRTIGIFPEGALSPVQGGLGFCRPHTGAARLALSAGVPVVPVGVYLDRARIRFMETEIDGQTEVARVYLGGPYAVTVGEPMVLKGEVEDRPYVRDASGQIMERIASLSHEGGRRVARNGRRETRSSGILEWGKLLEDAR